MTKPCHCPAYNFPHRFGGGKCVGEESAPKCTNCGKECSIYESTESTPYEFWGERGYHTEHYSGSDCCDADIFYGPMGVELCLESA